MSDDRWLTTGQMLVIVCLVGALMWAVFFKYVWPWFWGLF